MHATLWWWSIWGLILGIGLFGLQGVRHNPLNLIIALPLMTGAMAAAVLRLRHEYHEAMEHARWVIVSGGLLLLGMGFLFLKAEAYGPFASASAHKAFLGTTFAMSVPEAERALGRKLEVSSPEPVAPEGLKEWVLEVVPDFDRKPEIRTLPELVVYRIPCQVQFEFFAGKLGKVGVTFQDTTLAETTLLVRRIQQDLAKDYKQVDASGSTPTSLLYRKDSVDAVISQIPVDVLHQQVSVVLQYLPLAEEQPGPLTVDTQAF